MSVPTATTALQNGAGLFIYQNVSGINELGVDPGRLFDDTDAEFRRAYEGKTRSS